MANESQIVWGTSTDFSTLTNLNSLDDGNIWQSGEQNDDSPSADILRISYELVFNTTPVAGDGLIFRLSQGDGAESNEIWSGGVGTSESEISTAANIAAVQQACPLVWTHYWSTNHGTTFKGTFDIFLATPSWQILIEADGEALASSGNRLRYRYGNYQLQS